MIRLPPSRLKEKDFLIINKNCKLNVNCSGYLFWNWENCPTTYKEFKDLASLMNKTINIRKIKNKIKELTRMSSCFYISLVSKKTKEEVCLFQLSTTPARELYDNLYLEYNKNTLLTEDKYQEICTYYEHSIADWKKCVEKNEQDTKDLLNVLSKAISSEVAGVLYEQKLNNDSYIEECIKIYGLGIDCDYQILSVEDI